MSVIRRYVGAFSGVQAQMLRELDAALDGIATRVGGAQVRAADSPAHARQMVSTPTAPGFSVVGGNGRFVVTINNPQATDSQTVSQQRAKIKSGINTAQTQILHQLQSATASSFDNAAQVIDYGASPQIRYEITSPNETRYFRLRSSFDGQTWSAWQIFPGTVQSGSLPGGSTGGGPGGDTGPFIPMSYLSTDPTLSDNSDAEVGSQKAVKSYIDAGLATKMPVFAFVDDETVAGTAFAWTLANAPNPPTSLILIQQLPGFGSIVLVPGTDYTLTSAAIATTNSLTAGDLRAWYRH